MSAENAQVAAEETLMSLRDYLTNEDIHERLKNDMRKYSSQEFQTTVEQYIPPWLLDHWDPHTQQQNSVESEFQRLKILKTYSIVGEPADEDFVRLTYLARRLLNTPISSITTIDLDKCWCFATTVDGVTESPRPTTMCSHTILNKGKTLVVPDASKDFRFANQAAIAGPPYVRFYAAAPLIVPENVRIGTICVMGMEARPGGITDEENQTLQDLAATTVRMLVDRRKRMDSISAQQDLIASFSHDVMTPLTGLQLSLSILNDDRNLHRMLNQNQRELFDTSVNCCDLMVRLYQSVAKTMREGMGNEASTASILSNSESTGQLADIVSFLKQVMKALPTDVPIIIDVEDTIQGEMIADELIVFRAALTFLSTACARTKKSFIRHRLYRKGERIIFEFEDAAPMMSTRDSQVFLGKIASTEFMDPTLAPLRYGTSLLNSIQVKYGVQSRGPEVQGSVFWFAIKASSPQNKSKNPQETSTIVPLTIKNNLVSSQISKRIKEVCNPSEVALSVDSTKQTGKTALIIDDSLVIRKGIARMLSLILYTVQTAENGLEGLQCMMRQTYDIVLCDFLMPVMDGFDCVRQFRSWESMNRSSSSRQLIVGISAHADGNDSQKGLEAGMDLFYSKPITTSILSKLDDLIAKQDHKTISEEPKATPIVNNNEDTSVMDSTYQSDKNTSMQNSKADASDQEPFLLSLHQLLHPTSTSLSNTILDTMRLENKMKLISHVYVDTLRNQAYTTSSEIKLSPVAHRLKLNGTGSDGIGRGIVEARELITPEAIPLHKAEKVSMPDTMSSYLHILGMRRCLIATNNLVQNHLYQQESFHTEGWDCKVTMDGAEMIQQLQILNWDLVIVNESLGCNHYSPTHYIREFRSWESKHRITRQSNVFLDCSFTNDGGCPDADDVTFKRFVQPPFGFDAVLLTMADWERADRSISTNGNTGLSSIHLIMRESTA